MPLKRSKDELSLSHRGDRHEQVLESDDFFGRYDVVTDIQALNLTFFERVGEQLDIIHYNQVVAYVQVLQCAIALSDDFREFASRFPTDLGV